MDKKPLPKKSSGCGCGQNKPVSPQKTALDEKRQQLINRIVSRRQKENPIYKTRNKLFL